MIEHYSLSEHCFLKILEKPFIYNRREDELYELDAEGLDFLEKLIMNGISTPTSQQKKFINFLLKEKLVVKNKKCELNTHLSSPVPSLRYLELQLTKKCNLKCKHCYLGEAENIELPLKKAIEVVKSFEEMQGLKLLVSGGEPLLYARFHEFNEFLKDAKLRRVLITNGIVLSKVDLKSLNFDEVQVSVDGMEEAHDKLRGKGTFRRTMEGIQKLANVQIDISIATMVTNYNLNDFKTMQKLFQKLKVKSWGIDLPCISGYLKENPHIVPAPETAAKLMKYAFGGGYHGSDGAFICGNHLLTVSADGNVAKCGFYLDSPYGNIYNEDLKSIWEKALHIPVNELKDCRGCKFVETCLGGCRFRADSPYGKDRVMCYFYGVM